MYATTCNLLDALPEIRARVARGTLLVGLDFDGTLVPFADRPEKVWLDDDGRRLLESLRSRPGVRVAIISGRRLDDLVARVGVDRIGYAGLHGAEVHQPDGTTATAGDLGARALASEACEALQALVGNLPNVWVEDKGLIVAVHLRQADAEAREEMLFRLATWRLRLPKGLRERDGDHVIEFIPYSLPSKGDAVSSFVEAWGIAGAEQVIYVGDDETDEEAFRQLRPSALTAHVGPANSPTDAAYWLEDPEDVRNLLQVLLIETEER